MFWLFLVDLVVFLALDFRETFKYLEKIIPSYDNEQKRAIRYHWTKIFPDRFSNRASISFDLSSINE